MVWNNSPITLYHGTDNLAAAAIVSPQPPMQHGINLSAGNKLSDFGRGFYMTTNLKQAKNWANQKYAQTSNPAAVIKFDVDRDKLAFLTSLTFVTEDTGGDYWSFITHCRNGKSPHGLWGTRNYDAVFGPVSLWPQTLVIKDCDQVSFHTISSLHILSRATISMTGNPKFII